MMIRYKQLLTYIKTAVTRNHSEKSINSILDYISTSKNVLNYNKYCLLIVYEFIAIHIQPFNSQNAKTYLLYKHFHQIFRWNYCKISMRRRLKRWRMPRMIDCGLKLIQNLENCIMTGMTFRSLEKFWSNFTNLVRCVFANFVFNSHSFRLWLK